MHYRFLFAMLVVFVAVACGDSSSPLRSKNELAAPTLPVESIVAAAFTVGSFHWDRENSVHHKRLFE